MQAWYSFVIVIIVTHGNRKPWCRPLLIMELCHFFLCVFLIEWVLAVHARYSGGVRLGNLMLDSHLLGPHTSSTPDYCITDPSRKSSWYWHNTCSLSGNFPRDHILLLGLMSAEVSHPEDALTMLPWQCEKNSCSSRSPECLLSQVASSNFYHMHSLLVIYLPKE